MTTFNTVAKTFLLSLFVFLVACSSPDASPLAEISPQEASKLFTNETAVIVDVRTQAEWDAGHIPGAVHIPLSEVKGRLDEFKAFEGQEIVMQCRSGKRSAAAGKILLSAGYEDVSNLTGGINAWGKAKLPVEQ